jgi:hypothetical protein
MKIIEFVFSGFWIFVGTAILLSIIFDGISDIIKACIKGKEKDINKPLK